jgi:hypothetical protein
MMEHDLNWQIDWVPRHAAGSWKRRHELSLLASIVLSAEVQLQVTKVQPG